MMNVRKFLLSVFTGALILMAGANIASSEITGTKHDFSSQSWSGGEICAPCHTPHNADKSVTAAPLWNHEVTTSTFTLYTSQTMDPRYPAKQPRGESKVCLSCHDGTVALDSFGGKQGTTFMEEDAKLGTDLQDDHPISIAWGHQTQIRNCVECHFRGERDVPFFNRHIECSSCHDVHGGKGFDKLLRMTPEKDRLCFKCHQK